MLIDASQDELGVKINALGFHFLEMSLSNKEVQLDISKTEKKGDEFFISKTEFKKQIEKQLPSSMKLTEVMSDTLFFNFQEIVSKIVPVKPNIKINLAQNYLLEGELLIQPDSITIKGPKNQVDTIDYVKSSKIDLTKLTADFSKKTAIIKSKVLSSTYFSNESVTVSGKVSKFSEKKITLKIEVLHLPSDISIKTFPEHVDVICIGTLEILKELDVSDFQVLADYRQLKINKSQKLSLVLHKKPSKLYNATLEETEVKYIVRRK
jgi:YbbR domain-containing protein